MTRTRNSIALQRSKNHKAGGSQNPSTNTSVQHHNPKAMHKRHMNDGSR
jgi:hypothetical protein